jgi:hypothetical protein
MASLVSIVGIGGFQSPSGTPLAGGQLKVQLLEDIAQGVNQICAGRIVWFPLDSDGNVASGSLWSPALYEFTAYSAQGQPVWQMFVNFVAPVFYDLIVQVDGLSTILLVNGSGGALAQAA